MDENNHNHISLSYWIVLYCCAKNPQRLHANRIRGLWREKGQDLGVHLEGLEIWERTGILGDGIGKLTH